MGAALNFSGVRSWVQPVAVSSLVKFLAMPVLTLVVGHAIGLTDVALMVALLFQALPTASSSYIMARQLGGDAPLMAGITAAQTVLAAAAMPAVMTLLVVTRGLPQGLFSALWAATVGGGWRCAHAVTVVTFLSRGTGGRVLLVVVATPTLAQTTPATTTKPPRAQHDPSHSQHLPSCGIRCVAFHPHHPCRLRRWWW